MLAQMPLISLRRFEKEHFMTKIVTIAGYLSIFVCVDGFAQSAVTQTGTNWGKIVEGVHLSIVANGILTNEMLTRVEAKIENLSTNNVSLRDFLGAANFDVVLLDNSGQAFHVVNTRAIAGSSVPMILGPGTTRSWQIPLVIGKAFKSGDYELVVSRNFSREGELFELKSNSVEVHLK
jgi:hypothetical protein